MTLTKKNFEAIAEILHRQLVTQIQQANESNSFDAESRIIDTIENLMEELGDYFAEENPSFNRFYFKEAVEHGKIDLKDAKRKKVNE